MTIAAMHIRDEIDICSIPINIARMVEKDIHIVARSTGIPWAGCRDDDHAS